MSSSSFDPYTQSFALLLADGVTPFNVSISDLDSFVLYNSQICVNYGTQIGASIIMLMVVLLVTRDSKRRTPIFVVNVLSLILSFLRSLLQTLYWVGPFSESYAYFSGDYSAVPRSAYANSIASITLTLLFVICIEISLVLQVRAVCGVMILSHRIAILLMSSAVALLAIGFRFADVVYNAETILATTTSYDIEWLASAALITETISIWYFCIIFISKLAWAVYARRNMNVQQWGPMQIFVIAGSCTMVIPSIFAILEYFPDTTFPEAGSQALTTVAILLPLSSVWAAASMEGAAPVGFDSSPQYRGSASRGTSKFSNLSAGTSIPGGSHFDRKGSLGQQLSPTSVLTTASHVPVDKAYASMGKSADASSIFHEEDFDFEGFGGGASGVMVEKSYSVHSGSKSGNSRG